MEYNIRNWIEKGIDLGATHMFLVTKHRGIMFDFEDIVYPEYVMPGEDVDDRDHDIAFADNLTLNEIYDLAEEGILNV